VIHSYNAILPALAEEARAAFIPLPPMPEHRTLDGIHLNAAGYEAWEGRPRRSTLQIDLKASQMSCRLA
jgi:lysophospholipase L1-like esterase